MKSGWIPEVSDAIEEVINGEVRITRAPKWFHARILELVSRLLASQLDEPEYFVATAQFGLVIRKQPLTVRVPDLAVFQKRSIVEQDGFVHSAPQLIAEVLSPGERIAGKARRLRRARGARSLGDLAGSAHGGSKWPPGPRRPHAQLFPSVAVEIARMWPD